MEGEKTEARKRLEQACVLFNGLRYIRSPGSGDAYMSALEMDEIKSGHDSSGWWVRAMGEWVCGKATEDEAVDAFVTKVRERAMGLRADCEVLVSRYSTLVRKLAAMEVG